MAGNEFQHPRGQREGDGSPHARGDNGRGRIPAFVFAGVSCERGDGDGSPHVRGGQREGRVPVFVFTGVGCEQGGTGMGSRMREDNGRGGFPPASLRAWVMSGKTGGYRHI